MKVIFIKLLLWLLLTILFIIPYFLFAIHQCNISVCRWSENAKDFIGFIYVLLFIGYVIGIGMILFLKDLNKLIKK